MLNKINIALIKALTLSLTVFFSSAIFAGDFEDQLNMDGQTLTLNGEGPRKKAFLTIYDTALYLTEKSSDAVAIIAADHPMAISMIIRSKLASAKRISDAFSEGLEKSTGGNVAPIEAETNAFLEVFKLGVVKNDLFQFVYVPKMGTKIYKNDEIAATIEGLTFKQALFGIWLSDAPVADKLKRQLLGQ